MIFFIFFFFFKTALYLAIENNNAEMVDFLLSHPNIDPNIQVILCLFFHTISKCT